MADRREDLLALDEHALVTLANRGLVNRAKKIVERGDGPALESLPDGTLVATSGEVTTRLIPDHDLADSQCSCPSSGVCRHRLAAVLQYQRSVGDAEPSASKAWSPAIFTDEALTASLGRRVMSRARAARNKGIVAEIRRVTDTQAVPAVRLSTATVQFLVPEDLAYARCDCAEGSACEHIVLAVWAFAEASDSNDDPILVVELGRRADSDLEPLCAALELAQTVLLEGVANIGDGVVARFAAAERSLADAGLVWPRDVVQALESSLSEYRRRGASYHPDTPAALVGELHARARAAAGEGVHPVAAILGQDVAAETRLDHLRLTALGARVTGSADLPKVEVFLAVPDERMVLVFRREFAVDPEVPAPSNLVMQAALPGVPLGTLARGQIVTAAARRRANRELLFGRSVVAKTSVVPQRGDWGNLPEPVLVRDFDGLRDGMRTSVPAMIGPRYLADRMHVLAVNEVTDYVYSAAEQRIEFAAIDPQGVSLRVRLEHTAAAPGALGALATACRRGIRFVAGEVRLDSGALVIDPISVVTDRVVALHLEEPGGERVVASPGLADAHPDPLVDTLRAAQELVGQGIHNGLLRAPGRWLDAVEAVARRLRDVGLAQTSVRLGRLQGAVTQMQLRDSADLRQEAARRWVDAAIRLRLSEAER